VTALLSSAPSLSAQDGPSVDALHRPLDELLDLYVRDGLVYYLALRGDRAKLDRYIASVGGQAAAAAYPNWTKNEQAAFWVNAYNAFVLRTVIDQYPIRAEPKSIHRPAFDRFPAPSSA
jgi:hypothetical protein